MKTTLFILDSSTTASKAGTPPFVCVPPKINRWRKSKCSILGFNDSQLLMQTRKIIWLNPLHSQEEWCKFKNLLNPASVSRSKKLPIRSQKRQ